MHFATQFLNCLIFECFWMCYKVAHWIFDFSLGNLKFLCFYTKYVLVTWCRSILKYFEFAPPPFERISKEGKNPWLCGKVC